MKLASLAVILLLLPAVAQQYNASYYAIEDQGTSWRVHILDWSIQGSPYITYTYEKTAQPKEVYDYILANIKSAYPNIQESTPEYIKSEFQRYKAGVTGYQPAPVVQPAEPKPKPSIWGSFRASFTGWPWWADIAVILAFIGILLYIASKMRMNELSQVIVLITGLLFLSGVGILPMVYFFLPVALFLAGMIIRVFVRGD